MRSKALLLLTLVATVAVQLAHAAEPPAPSPTAARPTPAPECPVDFTAPFADGAAGWHELPVPAPRKIAWEESLGGKEAARPHIRARLRGWPERIVVDPDELPEDDRAFLERVASDTWRGLDAFTDRENGLPVDTVQVAGAPLGWHVGDYTNVTNVGLHLIAVVGAQELGLIDEDAARARIVQVFDTLERLESHAGYLYNFYDTTSLERTSNFISFVDLSWLTAGLIVVRQAFPDLAARSSEFMDRMPFKLFYDDERGLVLHGYYANRGVPSRYHYGVLYTEARLGILLAIGRGDIPESAWYRMARIYPASCEGQMLEPIDLRLEEVRGYRTWLGFYEWGGLRYVPSWGGSMFEALMPTLVLDELRHAPRSLGENDRRHAVVQQRYATEALGYPVWGISPCAEPDGSGYREYGVRVLGTRGYRAGAVTPHATALALAVDPAAATAGLRRFASEYRIYGELGFYDAVDPRTRQVVYTYLTLDQSMLFIAVANHLTSGAIQRHFAADPIVERVLPLLGEESWFE